MQTIEQKLFNKVLRHLRKQGVRSMRSDDDCAYRPPVKKKAKKA
jgi:hypothetical protein